MQASETKTNCSAMELQELMELSLRKILIFHTSIYGMQVRGWMVKNSTSITNKVFAKRVRAGGVTVAWPKLLLDKKLKK